MTKAMKQTLANIKVMSQHERALLAHCLISSLDKVQDEDVEEAWFQLAEKRWSQLKSGEVKAVTWEEITKGMRN